MMAEINIPDGFEVNDDPFVISVVDFFKAEIQSIQNAGGPSEHSDRMVMLLDAFANAIANMIVFTAGSKHPQAVQQIAENVINMVAFYTQQSFEHQKRVS
ncbi:MAG: hypothetical protein ACFBZ9_01270 [Sphingomonadales bacterium]